jgi:hypothetical protein
MDLLPTVTVGTFPSGASYSAQQFADAFAARLTLTIPSGNVLFGQLGGTEPLSPLPGNGAAPGLWVNGNTLYAWNVDNAKYLPLPPVAGQIVNGVIYITEFRSGAHTASTVLTSPDKSGIIATLSDVGNVLGTQTPTGTAITADWTLKQQVYLVLTGNTTLTQSGPVDGQYQDFWIENNATAYTVTWSGITWPAATAPTITTASAGQRRIDHIRLYQVGSTTFGEAVKQNYQISTGTDSTPPTVSTLQGFGSNIYVTMSELLQGGDMGVGNFIVKKGTAPAVTQTINSATASGSAVTLVLASSFGSSAHLTIQYTGSTIKDISGNLAAAFGPSPVVVTSSAGGGTGGSGGSGNAP